MAPQTETEIILYDLACTKNTCFSPVVWRIRLILNYKNIPYKTVFLEFPDIEPTLKEFGLAPHASSPRHKYKYTVPAIRHLPSNTYMMDSAPISQFLESTYPDPPLPLTSDFGREIENKTFALLSPALYSLLTPRELAVLSPRSEEYFRRTREAFLGHRVEDLLNPEKEEELKKAVDEGIGTIGELLQTHRADGPFVLGARPTYTDFFIAGSLEFVKLLDHELFSGMVKHPGYGELYDACQQYMEQKD